MAEIIDIRAYREERERGEETLTKLEFEARKMYLETYLSLKRMAEANAMELAELEQTIGPGAMIADGMPRSSRKSDGSDRIISRMTSMERIATAIRHETYEMERKRAEVVRVIEESAHGRYSEVLRLCYINGKDLGEVADAMNYSYRQIVNIHKRAIQRIKPPRREIDKLKKALSEIHVDWQDIEIKPA